MAAAMVTPSVARDGQRAQDLNRSTALLTEASCVENARRLREVLAGQERLR